MESVNIHNFFMRFFIDLFKMRNKGLKMSSPDGLVTDEIYTKALDEFMAIAKIIEGWYKILEKEEDDGELWYDKYRQDVIDEYVNILLGK